MAGIRMKYDEDFKKNAVSLSYASNKTVRAIARDLGISEGLIYVWRKKHTSGRDKIKYATLEEENKGLRLELAELKIERDMLKKATAYFASLNK